MGNTKNNSKRKALSPPPMEELVIGGAVYKTRLTAKFRNRIKWERPDERNVVAFIPGTIQEIMVKEGMEVIQGAPLLILEAMKMKNILLSPMSGAIKRIHVSVGDQVPKSRILLEFK